MGQQERLWDVRLEPNVRRLLAEAARIDVAADGDHQVDVLCGEAVDDRVENPGRLVEDGAEAREDCGPVREVADPFRELDARMHRAGVAHEPRIPRPCHARSVPARRHEAEMQVAEGHQDLGVRRQPERLAVPRQRLRHRQPIAREVMNIG
jgi:hypothetical protein